MLDRSSWHCLIGFAAKRGDIGGIREALAMSEKFYLPEEAAYLSLLARWRVLDSAAKKAAQRGHPLAAAYLRDVAGEKPKDPDRSVATRLGEVAQLLWETGTVRQIATWASGAVPEVALGRAERYCAAPSARAAHFLFETGPSCDTRSPRFAGAGLSAPSLPSPSGATVSTLPKRSPHIRKKMTRRERKMRKHNAFGTKTNATY
jgi:hypothetical protein